MNQAQWFFGLDLLIWFDVKSIAFVCFVSRCRSQGQQSVLLQEDVYFWREAERTRDCGGGLGSTCWLAFILAHDVRSWALWMFSSIIGWQAGGKHYDPIKCREIVDCAQLFCFQISSNFKVELIAICVWCHYLLCSCWIFIDPRRRLQGRICWTVTALTLWRLLLWWPECISVSLSVARFLLHVSHLLSSSGRFEEQAWTHSCRTDLFRRREKRTY